ncbi:hypothetical protein V9K67_20970 [Paraflavisolibacter sp. H34]|uniref:hypothetical protein n=1 Tax=Huijunlia imazamoxiresistens TaxID=3127457 RepID=UPI00301763B9
MKKKMLTAAALAVFFAACKKSDAPLRPDAYEPVAAAAKPATPQDAIHFTAPFVFPEGVVYDPFNDRFLVSSIAQGTIGAVTREGVYSPIIQDAALASTAGMEIDKGGKRLLVANANVEGTLAQLAVYDLKSGSRIFLADLAAVANDGAPHLANDVAIDPQGNAYVTDSYAGIIYKVTPSGKASILFQDAAFTPPPGGFGLNGIEYHKSGYLLVGHSYTNSILKIQSDGSSYTKVQLETPISVPDGLLLSKDGKQLLVVNNGAGYTTDKVLTFNSKDNWKTATATGTFSTTDPVYLSTVTSDGKTGYALHSYIHLLMGGQAREVFTLQPLPFNDNHPF